MQSIICCIVKPVYCSDEANFGHRTKNLYFRYITELLWRDRFKLVPANVSFVADKLTLGHVFCQVFQLSPNSITSPMLPTHISLIYHQCCIILVNDSVVKQNIHIHVYAHVHACMRVHAHTHKTNIVNVRGGKKVMHLIFFSEQSLQL
jgi:hypothetical protein